MCELPPGKKEIGCNWIYKTKFKPSFEVEKYKARLVAKGYSQEYGVNYDEVFALVARMDTVRLFLALRAQRNWPIF